MAEINHNDRAHALLSASSAQRWLACTPSAVASEAYPSQETEYTREGTLAHETAEAILRGEPIPKGADAEMIRYADEYRDYINGLVTTDHAVMLSEQRVDFSTWVPDGFGTCDCILIQDDTLTIVDYKYGVGVPVSAVHNPQMRLYALGAMSEYGFAYEIKTIETHIFQPRIGNISTDTINATALLEWADDVLAPRAKLAAVGAGTYQAGAHCQFCPHAGRCRALADKCQTFVETHQVRVAVPVLAPFEVANVLAMEPLVTLWLKRVKAQALDTLLNGGDIPGYKAVAGRGTRAWDDELAVAQAMEAAGFAREDYTETVLLSPAKLEKAIGKKRTSELLAAHIEKHTGAPTIAPVTDKRPAYDRLAEAREDFK